MLVERPASRRERLTGWGRTAPSVATVVHPAAATLPTLLDSVGERGALARGLGRCYGDAAQNGGGTVVRLDGSADSLHLDPASGTMTVGAGISIDTVLRTIVPRGWFVPVTPGTRHVTIGGAIASDIHGKNHHADGSFGSHVRGLSLLTSDGSVLDLGPDRDPELFWATVGGMGLTGIVLEATVDLIPIETSRCLVDTERAANLDDVLAMMSEGDDRYRYSVAWLDLMARGAHLGRAVLGRGDHAPLDALEGAARRDPLAFAPRTLATVPPIVPPRGVLDRWTIGAFNEVWYRKAPKRRVGQVQSLGSFFHPLDAVAHWNRLYGRGGFIQYQFVVPFGTEDVLARIVERCARIRAASFVTVLKRFGPGNPAPLSFPTPGWTLTIDLATSQPGIGDLVSDLDRMVLDAGGRHYLAKDALSGREAIRAGYPRLEEWQAVRDKLDPVGMWRSDLGRRLGLIG